MAGAGMERDCRKQIRASAEITLGSWLAGIPSWIPTLHGWRLERFWRMFMDEGPRIKEIKICSSYKLRIVDDVHG